MKQFDPIHLMERSELLGLGEHMRGSEIAYHVEAIEHLLASVDKISKSITPAVEQETDVDITVRMLQEKYGKK